MPEVFSPTSVEEFLADGVIVFYNFRRENVRETALEILKMRGEKHQKKIVAFKITDTGIKVYPDHTKIAKNFMSLNRSVSSCYVYIH